MTEERESLDSSLLERYWLGESDPGDTARVEAWFAAHPDRQARYTQLRNGLRAGPEWKLSPSEAAEWSAGILRAIETPRPSGRVKFGQRAEPRVPFLRSAMGYVGVGAVVAVVCLIVGWLSGVRRLSTTLSAHTSMYATANGERATITLPDGSTVVLNVASRLQVPADYAAGNHTVELSGEALFTVAHHRGTPFTVIAGRSVTRVLGTSFVVRHYVTDSATTVAVREGKVAVGNTLQQATVVTAAEEIDVEPRGVGSIHPADLAQFSFARGVLTLNDVPLPRAIPELNRWYDVDIRLGDLQLATQGVTGECATGSLAELSELLGKALNVRVVRTGRVLTLFAR